MQFNIYFLVWINLFLDICFFLLTSLYISCGQELCFFPLHAFLQVLITGPYRCTHWIDYRAFWGSQFLFKLLGMWYARDLLICVRYSVTLWTFVVLLTLIFRAQRAKVWTQNKGSKNWGLEHLAGVKYSFIPPTEHLLYARHSTEYGLLFLCHFPQFLPILRQDKLICSAILPSFRFWLKGTFLGPLVSKPFPILNSATWLSRGALKNN